MSNSLPTHAEQPATSSPVLSHGNTFSIGYHHCLKNIPKLTDLSLYIKEISSKWKDIGVQLDISQHDIFIIDHNVQNLSIEDKCFDMLGTWLQITKSPCWCHFIKAVIKVKLDKVAEKANKAFMLKCSHYEDDTLS